MGFAALLKLGRLIDEECRLGGRFQPVRFPLRAGPAIKLVQFTREHENIGPVHGLGSALTFKQAQLIAYFEYLDRLAFYRAAGAVRTTNGVAAHVFKALARRSARRELIERDAVMAHWLTATPFTRLPIPREYGTIVVELSAFGLELAFAETALGVKPVRVCFLLKPGGGFVLGSSTGGSLHTSLYKAFVEAVISYFYGSYGEKESTLRERLARDGFTTLQAHRTYWLYERTPPDWLFEAAPPNNLRRGFSPRYSERILARTPFPVVQVSSVDLLDLHVGLPTNEDVARLSRRLVEQTQMSSEPHPIF